MHGTIKHGRVNDMKPQHANASHNANISLSDSAHCHTSAASQRHMPAANPMNLRDQQLFLNTGQQYLTEVGSLAVLFLERICITAVAEWNLSSAVLYCFKWINTEKKLLLCVLLYMDMCDTNKHFGYICNRDFKPKENVKRLDMIKWLFQHADMRFSTSLFAICTSFALLYTFRIQHYITISVE